MIVPHDALSPDTLRALIEEFISREGAVHGHRDADPETMVGQVMAQLKKGIAVIVYDEASESCSIVTQEDAARMESEREAMQDDPAREIHYDENPPTEYEE